MILGILVGILGTILIFGLIYAGFAAGKKARGKPEPPAAQPGPFATAPPPLAAQPAVPVEQPSMAIAALSPAHHNQSSDDIPKYSEQTNIGIDRTSIRHLVEDFWRSLILYGRHLGESHPTASLSSFAPQFTEFSRRFHEKNTATAALMPPHQASEFLQIIDEEDNICFEEHQHNRDALYRRLGLSLTREPPIPQHVIYRYQRQGIGEMMVRTAIRATIWEVVFSIFRR